MRLRHAAALLALQLVVALAFLADTGPGFPLDDTWIHMVYARALGQGQGFAYNPGQLETGVTAPLWTTLLGLPVALSDSLGIRPDLSTRALSLLTGFALACAGWMLAGRVGRLPAVCAAVALSIDPTLVFDRFSGMEQPLFGLLSLLLALTLLTSQWRRAGLVCGGLILTRPEGLVLVLAALVFTRHKRGRLLHVIGPAVLCVLPWAVYCQLASGRPWPSTFENKADLVVDVATSGRAVLAILADTGWGWALPVAVALGAYVLEGGQHLLGRLPLLFALLLIPAVALSRPLEMTTSPTLDAAPVPYYWARYVLLAWPLLVLPAGVGVASLLRTAFAGTRCRPAYAAVLIGPLVVLLLLGKDLPAHAAVIKQRFEDQCEDTELLNVAAGRWVDEHVSSAGLVATHDAGAVRYFGKRPVLDLWGNHNSGLTRALREGGPAGAAAFLANQRPEVLVVFPVLYAAGHAPEVQDLWAQMPQQDFDALMAQADDYAAFFGLTHRAATFTLPRPAAVVPGPLQTTMAIYDDGQR